MRSGMAYIPLDFRNSLEDNARILDFGDADVLFFQARFAGQLPELRARLPRLRLLVCLDAPLDDIPGLAQWCAEARDTAPAVEVPPEATAWLRPDRARAAIFAWP